MGQSSEGKSGERMPDPNSTSCQPPQAFTPRIIQGPQQHWCRTRAYALGSCTLVCPLPCFLLTLTLGCVHVGTRPLPVFPSVSMEVQIWLGVVKPILLHNSRGRPSHRRQCKGTGCTREGWEGLLKQRPPAPRVYAPSMRHSWEQSSATVK